MSDAGRPLETLSAVIRAKLVRGQRVSPALISALDGICPGWRGHDDLYSLVRLTVASGAYLPAGDDTEGHQREL